MAKRISNRGRIARMREEADATGAEKKKKKRATTAKPTRFKYVWAVKSGAGKIVAAYPYPRKAAAEAAALRLKQSEQSHFLVVKHKVAFEG